MERLFQLMKAFSTKTLPAIILLFSTGCSVLANGVRVTNYGHSALLIEGGGQSVLLNPFKSVGCATGLKEPKITANIILASSELADEGARIAKGKFLVEPGSYKINGLKIEGFSAPHDRLNGRRFGQATLWSWKQGGLNFAHLGGSAAKLSIEDKILLGKPDVLIIGVGGGAKVYNGKEASEIVKELNPKNVIPVQYLKRKAHKDCDQSDIQPFLEAIQDAKIIETGRKIYLKKRTSKDTIINIMK